MLYKSDNKMADTLVKKELIKKSAHSKTIILIGATDSYNESKFTAAFWEIYRQSEYSTYNLRFVRYGDSKVAIKDLQEKTRGSIKNKDGFAETIEAFLAANLYIPGNYSDRGGYKKLSEELEHIEEGYEQTDRIFHIALRGSLLQTATQFLAETCMSKTGSTRVVIDSPIGRDRVNPGQLSEHLLNLFTEKQIYRINHHLDYETIQHIMVLRFANLVFGSVWNQANIACVKITYKGNDRSGYHDKVDTIMDIMQNDLMQVLCFVAMNKPCSKGVEDIRDERLKVMRRIAPVTMENMLIKPYPGNATIQGDKTTINGDSNTINGHDTTIDGHNTSINGHKTSINGNNTTMNGNNTTTNGHNTTINGHTTSINGNAKNGHLDDDDSNTSTYACTIVNISNERWDGVPFILTCGEGFEEKMAEIRVQFQDVPGDIFNGNSVRNELLIQMQPEGEVSCKLMTSKPGTSIDPMETELDLTCKPQTRSEEEHVHSYVRSLCDVIDGNQLNFMRSDEVAETWRIFAPVLSEINNVRK